MVADPPRAARSRAHKDLQEPAHTQPRASTLTFSCAEGLRLLGMGCSLRAGDSLASPPPLVFWLHVFPERRTCVTPKPSCSVTPVTLCLDSPLGGVLPLHSPSAQGCQV